MVSTSGKSSGSGLPSNLVGLLQIPQDPFLPNVDFQGPAYLDQQACLCVIQETPEENSDDAVWHCHGKGAEPAKSSGSGDSDSGKSDDTKSKDSRDSHDSGNEQDRSPQDDIYHSVDGKFFPTTHGRSQINGKIYDSSNPARTGTALVWDPKARKLTDNIKAAKLSVNDNVCTGKNWTVFSTALYRTTDELANNKAPVDAVPCYQPGGVPVVMQNETAWQKEGCNKGFFCPNNTINSLPQYCPPLTSCQEARVAGKVCSINGLNIGMGPFEPTICDQGYYCPSGGTERVKCPTGHYCQLGAATPTPCIVGSHCPEGVAREFFLIPFALILVIDVILIAGGFCVGLRGKFRSSAQGHISALKHRGGGGGGGVSAGPGGIVAQVTGYKRLEDDGEEYDQEMMPMPVQSASQLRRGRTVFESVLQQRANFRLSSYHTQAEQPLPPELLAFIDSMKKATDTSSLGLSFGYDGLRFQPKGVARPILQDVTGSIERGTLAAVMGGSGAGKSTFVNVLMGKTSHTGGSVTVNGSPGKISRYRKLISYVPQDDIVLPELTVYENIAHSARIRLPRTWSKAAIESHVDSVIDCLDLSHVRDSIVGSVGKAVLSGGQRKRVSIGMELAAGPMAIFLDEPTSGLDSTTASSIMQTLKALARLGITVIVIIHQPRHEIYEMLDNLILLGDGQTIYEGQQGRARPFFEGIGYHFPKQSNVADVITDIITGNGREYKRVGSISKEHLIAHWKAAHDSERSHHANLIKTYPAHTSAADLSEILRVRGAHRITQGRLCLSRAMLQQYRAKGAFWSEMILAVLAGFLLGLAETSKKGILFRGLYKEPYGILSIATDFQSAPEMALLVAIAIGLVSAAPGVKVFSEELLVYKREAETGHSRIAYFLAKVISVLPRMTLACFHFTTPLFLLATPVMPWATAFLTNLLYFYCIYGLASCISMVVRRQDAPLFAVMISLIAGLLCGAAPPLAKVQQWHMEWLWRASPGTWLAEVYFGNLVKPFGYLYNIKLAAEATGFHLTWQRRNMGVLAGIGTIYRLVAFIELLLGDRLRR